MSDVAQGALEVGTNGNGEVVINHPDLMPNENGGDHIVFSVEQARNLGNLLLAKAADAASERGDFKGQFTNLSRRLWSEDECRIMINASLCKLIQDAGGMMQIDVADLFAAAPMGTLSMCLSDDDKILTLTQMKES